MQPLPQFLGIALGALALAIGGAPLGVLLVERRLSLIGDSLSHGILPGAALAFLLFGHNPWALTAGAMVAGCIVAGLSALLGKSGRLPEDAAFAAIYLPSLALGVLILGREASPETFEALLFGGNGSVDGQTLVLSLAAAAATLLALLFAFRRGEVRPLLLMILTALNLVAGFRTFGALMTVGLMMIPAAAAGFWAVSFRAKAAWAVAISAVASGAGLIISARFALETGAVMTLAAAALFVLSALFGAHNGFLRTQAPWNAPPSSPNRQP